MDKTISETVFTLVEVLISVLLIGMIGTSLSTFRNYQVQIDAENTIYSKAKLSLKYESFNGDTLNSTEALGFLTNAWEEIDIYVDYIDDAKTYSLCISNDTRGYVKSNDPAQFINISGVYNVTKNIHGFDITKSAMSGTNLGLGVAPKGKWQVALIYGGGDVTNPKPEDFVASDRKDVTGARLTRIN